MQMYAMFTPSLRIMKKFARFSVFIVFVFVSIQILLLSRNVSYHPVQNKYWRYNLNSDEIMIYNSQIVSEHPRSYQDVERRHSSSDGHRGINFAEGHIVETLPANQNGRLHGIKAGKVVKVIGENGSIVLEQRIANKYSLLRKLGEGTFGKVFLGTDVTSGASIAVKIEDTHLTHSHLHREEKVYRILMGGEGFPTVRWSGKEGQYNFLVTDLLGPSLYDYFHLCKKNFTLKTILLIADQLIRRLEYIHSAGFVHRDVKPENFVVGQGNKSDIIYSIDFGLAKVYRNQNNEHVPYNSNVDFAGTTTYASINTQLGIQQSRRDDMESLGYVLMYFLLGKLPWQKLHIKNKYKKRKNVLQLKQSLKIDNSFKGYPQEFAIYLKKCRSLQFDEEPDYDNLRLLFLNLLHRQNMTSDNVFDWHDSNGRCNMTMR